MKGRNKNLAAGLWARQHSWAAANTRLMFHGWWLVFTLAALLQIILWPAAENVACVLMAWGSCAATGLVILRSRVTIFHPWSSLLILMFCLQTSGLPLVCLLSQGDPLTHSLEVPELTYFHLLACQILLLVIHTFYRFSGMMQGLRGRFQKIVLQPLGFFSSLSFGEIMVMGGLGLASTIYIYVVVRADQGGTVAQTGPVLERLVNGLIPFSYAPFLAMFPSLVDFPKRGKQMRWAVLTIYFLILFGVAIGYNERSYMFTGFALAGTSVLLMLISGQIRLVLGKLLLTGVIGLLVMATVGADFANALRVARANRANKSAMELVQETLAILTVDRQRLGEVQEYDKSADEETRYVSNPVLCRLVQTHFEDEALAIALHLDERAKQTLRQVEIDKSVSVLPAPVLNLFGSTIDKNESMGDSIGDWMEYLGGRKPDALLSGFVTGGFIGDGYAAYGWGYLGIYGLIALLFFFFSDSLYVLTLASGGRSRSASRFAMVGLLNSFALVTILTSESIAALIGFALRNPLQWLIMYVLLLAAIRRVFRLLPGSTVQPSKPSGRLHPEVDLTAGENVQAVAEAP
jgi:hypothetical protein